MILYRDADFERDLSHDLSLHADFTRLSLVIKKRCTMDVQFCNVANERMNILAGICARDYDEAIKELATKSRSSQQI